MSGRVRSLLVISSTLLAWAGIGALAPRDALAAPPGSGAAAAPASTSPTDGASAEALFKKARALMDEGRTDEACGAFEESYRLDPAPGTLLNIGACNRTRGKTATAWSQFVDAERLFRRRGDDRRADFAKGEAHALEAGLSHVTLVAKKPATGMVVLRDGVEMHGGSIGTSLPIDPGPHDLVAKAEGRVPYKTRFEVAAGKDTTVEIPELAVAPVGADGGEPIVLSPQRGRTQRVLGWSAGGVGVGTMIIGGVFVGLVAERKSAADPHCPAKRCDPVGQAAIDRAGTYANVANVLIPTGAVLTAVGAVLLITAPKAPKALSSLEIVPSISPTTGYVGVEGRF